MSQPAWVNNIQLLQTKLYEILARVLLPTHVQYLLDEEALIKYWSAVFTHKSVNANPEKNYDTYEFYGDKGMNHVFAQHIRYRFGKNVLQDNGTLLMNRYMSKEFQASLAEKLGLPEFVRFDPQYPNVNINVKEDVLEAFFGCLETLADDRIPQGRGLGYIYCSNLINELFNDIPIILEDIRKDPITLLKERFEKLGWGKPQYTTKNSDDPRLGQVMAEMRNGQTGELLSIGYGTKDKAEQQAAQKALEKLEQQGITLEYADKYRLDRQRNRNSEFDRQYRRVEAAIDKLNGVARASGRATVSEFKITQIETHRAQGTQRYTFGVNVAWQAGDGKLNWKIVGQATGDNQDQTKIQTMKEFADKYEIPEDI